VRLTSRGLERQIRGVLQIAKTQCPLAVSNLPPEVQRFEYRYLASLAGEDIYGFCELYSRQEAIIRTNS
jgi:hypothetical protein